MLRAIFHTAMHKYHIPFCLYFVNIVILCCAFRICITLGFRLDPLCKQTQQHQLWQNTSNGEDPETNSTTISTPFQKPIQTLKSLPLSNPLGASLPFPPCSSPLSPTTPPPTMTLPPPSMPLPIARKKATFLHQPSEGWSE